MPADAATSTSPGVMIFTLLTIAVTLYAWWLSIDRSRRRQHLVRWLQEHRPQAWSGMPPSVRFLPYGGIEYLRRHVLADDPEFIERYRDTGRHNRRQLAMLLLAAAGIAVVQVGTRYLGWVW